jgi:hypothetical protein
MIGYSMLNGRLRPIVIVIAIIMIDSNTLCKGLGFLNIRYTLYVMGKEKRYITKDIVYYIFIKSSN